MTDWDFAALVAIFLLASPTVALMPLLREEVVGQ